MRGTLGLDAGEVQSRGIIPAYAGNTVWAEQSVACVLDHPRVCGEHAAKSFKSMADTGSSPRMRGTHELPVPLPQALGIIPAYAGNTPWSGRR